MKKISLSLLKEGKEGTVFSVNLKGKIKYRLLDIVIIPGARLKVIKTAPLGDPLQIEIKGYNLCIQKEIAQKIIIEVAQ